MLAKSHQKGHKISSIFRWKSVVGRSVLVHQFVLKYLITVTEENYQRPRIKPTFLPHDPNALVLNLLSNK